MNINHDYLPEQAKNPKILCFLDWLSVSYIIDRGDNEELISLSNVDGYIIESCTGTNVFATRFIVYDEQGRKKITWLADPKSTMINKNICLIEFANHTLYTGEWLTLFDILSKFHNGYFHGLSRVDICADFQFFINDDYNLEVAENLVQRIEESDYYIKGKQKGSAFYSYELLNDIVIKKPNQLSFGAKNSEIRWKIYNKTKEIQEESKKFYISDIHKKAGFDENINVWRLECSINHANSLNIIDITGTNILTLAYLKDVRNIANLFLTLLDNKFVVKRNDGCKNKNRNFTVNIFGNNFHSARFEKEQVDKRVLSDTAVKFVRNSISTINDFIFSTKYSLVDDLFKQIKKTVEIFELDEWFFNEFKVSVDRYYTEVILTERKSSDLDNIINNNLKFLQYELQFEN